MSAHRIPFNRPSQQGREAEYLAEALRSAQHSGDGPFTKKCQALLQRELGASRTLLTTSCTHALELAALLLEIKAGDEVIVPSFTFVSTANAFVLRGALPRFIDVRPDTLNLDERLLEQMITSHTRAIVPVHYAGVGCEMDVILAVARRHGVAVVEDNAHGLFGTYRGRMLGTFGCIAAQSFHETKNFSCGEGGAIILNDAQYLERAEIIREKGTDRSRFFRGQVDKYTWVDIGSSYLPSDLLAAYLYGQLEVWPDVQARRRRIWERYHEGLKDWAGRQGVRLPEVPPHCGQAYHMFYLLLPDLETRQRLIEHLRADGILGVFHYLPLHLSVMGVRGGGRAGQCPVAEAASDRLLRLPFYTSLSECDQDRVIERVNSFGCRASGADRDRLRPS